MTLESPPALPALSPVWAATVQVAGPLVGTVATAIALSWDWLTLAPGAGLMSAAAMSRPSGSTHEATGPEGPRRGTCDP